MAQRQDYPSSDPGSDIADAIVGARALGEANAKAIARGCLPEPLLFRATVFAPGPPPVFTIEIVNPLTGGVIVLGTI